MIFLFIFILMALIIFDALSLIICPAGYVAEARPSTIDIPAGLLDVALGSSGLRVFLRLLLIAAVNHLLKRQLQMLRSVMIILIYLNFHFFPILLKCPMCRFLLYFFFLRSSQHNQCTLQGWPTIFNLLMRWGCCSQRDVNLAVHYIWILRLRRTLRLDLRYPEGIS